MATLKTFMHGHLCITALPLESPMCSFTLPDICVILESNIVSHKKYKNNDYSMCFKIFMGFRRMYSGYKGQNVIKQYNA